MDMDFLVKQIRTPQQNLRLRQGEVVTINSDYTIDVKIAGDTGVLPSVRYMSNFAPLVGYHVWIVVDNNDMLAIGHVGRADKTLAPTAYRTTAQTITTDTQTKISFSAVDSDEWDCWSLSPNPTRLTVPVTGRYMVTANVSFEAASNGHRAINILLNNSTELARSDFLPVSNSIDTHSTVTTHAVTLTKTDYVELRVWHNKGSDLQILASGDHTPKMSLIYIGA